MGEETTTLAALSRQFMDDGVVITVGVNSKNEVINDICVYGTYSGEDEDPFCSREVTPATLQCLAAKLKEAWDYSNKLLIFIDENFKGKEKQL